MTLDEFRATGRDVPDLGAIEHIAASGIGAGRVYLDGLLYIERGPVTGRTWYLTIGNGQYVGNLADMERKLHEFAVSEGYINA